LSFFMETYCHWSDSLLYRQEKATQLVLDRMQQLEDRMTQMQAAHLEHITKLLAQRGISPAALDLHAKDNSISKLPPIRDDSSVERAANVDNQETGSQSESKDDSTPTGGLMPSQKKETAGDAGLDAAVKDEDDDELSIPVEHTTAAHKLLLWPSIKRLLAKDIDEDYVMKLEEERGLIRVYGRGEGDDRSDYDRASAASPSTTNSSPNWEEEYTHGASPNAPWGVGLPITASYRPREQAGGLDEFGQLNTEPEVVKRLHRSYIAHIHLLHPFLDETNLDRKVERFIKIYSPHKKSLVGQINHPAEAQRGAKRKRSSEALHVGGYDMSRSQGSNSEKTKPRRIERSIDNAIILLVLALGAICEWRDKPLPGPVKDHLSAPTTTSYLNSVLSPAMSESALPTGAFLSPEGGEPRKPAQHRPNSIGGPETSEYAQPKNMEVIPGLAYYAYATDILGNLQGGNGLYHVQAALLAGLYAGQLAHPFQSHGWISQSSRACQVLVRP
jgi:hypothetical protein